MKPRTQWWLGHRHDFALRPLTQLETEKLGIFVAPTYSHVICILAGECACGRTDRPVMCWKQTGKPLFSGSLSHGVEKGYLRRVA